MKVVDELGRARGTNYSYLAQPADLREGSSVGAKATGGLVAAESGVSVAQEL